MIKQWLQSQDMHTGTKWHLLGIYCVLHSIDNNRFNPCQHFPDRYYHPNILQLEKDDLRRWEALPFSHGLCYIHHSVWKLRHSPGHIFHWWGGDRDRMQVSWQKGYDFYSPSYPAGPKLPVKRVKGKHFDNHNHLWHWAVVTIFYHFSRDEIKCDILFR